MTTLESTIRAKESLRKWDSTATIHKYVLLSKSSMSSTRILKWKNSSLWLTVEMQSLSRKGIMTCMQMRLSSKVIRWMERMMRQWPMILPRPMVCLHTHSNAPVLSKTQWCQQIIIIMRALPRWVELKRITRWMTSSSMAAFQRKIKSDSTKKGSKSKCTSTNNNSTTIMDSPSRIVATQSQA